MLAHVLLSEHVLIPHDELEHAKLVRQGQVDREIKGRIFGVVDGIEGTLADGGLKPGVENRDGYKAGRRSDKEKRVDEWKGHVRVAEAIAIFGFEALAGKDANAENDDWSLAGGREESVSAAAATGGDTNGEASSRAEGSTDFETFLVSDHIRVVLKGLR